MKPAARLTDLHVCPMVTGVVPHVGGPIMPPCHVKTLIAGLPAARVTDKAVCVGPPDVIVSGSPTTLIAGLPAARMGDQTAHGGIISLGCMTVLIGDSGSAGGGGAGAIASSAGTLQGLTMRAAKKAAKPFCEECARKRAAAAKSANADQSAGNASPQRATLLAAKRDKLPFCEECERH